MTFYKNCRILGLLLLLLFLAHILVTIMGTKYEAFKACIFGSIGIRSVRYVNRLAATIQYFNPVEEQVSLTGSACLASCFQQIQYDLQ